MSNFANIVAVQGLKVPSNNDNKNKKHKNDKVNNFVTL